MILLLIASITTSCLAWQEITPTSNRMNLGYQKRNRLEKKSLHSTASESSTAPPPNAELSSSPLDGVLEFESWFSGFEGSKCNPHIQHASFGSLRGLITTDKSIGVGDSGSWMTIPRSMTLESDFNQPNWDAKLADSLWKEVLKGSSSSKRGYVSLLTKSWTINDLPSIPPFTAPDALRHWSDDEKNVLSAHPEGQALLDLQKRQVCDQTTMICILFLNFCLTQMFSLLFVPMVKGEKLEGQVQ